MCKLCSIIPELQQHAATHRTTHCRYYKALMNIRDNFVKAINGMNRSRGCAYCKENKLKHNHATGECYHLRVIRNCWTNHRVELGKVLALHRSV